MNNKALKTLEFDKIIEQLTAKAQSTLGKALCQQLLPYDDYETILEKQRETSEALSLIFQQGTVPIRNFKDLRPSLKRLKIGASLSMSELLNISTVLDIVAKVKNYRRVDTLEADALSIDSWFEMLSPLTPLNQEIKSCILSEEEMSDNASPTLKSIRRAIRNAHEKIRQQLNQLISSASVRNMLQETVVTMRNDRYCLPVKQEYRQQFSGMIHDQSSTGSTLFIEPMSVVKLNNEIKEYLSKEQEEIERILAHLSAKSSAYIEELEGNLKALTTLDFIFAKASLSKAFNGSEPVFNQSGYINIKKGRHPLLDPKSVVPIDIYLGDTFTMLMITGPNTGGKTVTLKTLGLFTLMGHAGLHIPAFDGSSLSYFKEVYADIGDEQSIEQNLSTFSSHMTNIIQILSEAKEDSLVLFDELGAGTDPTEGAALAMSILNDLHKRNIRTVATTHYSELKIFALSTEGIENASCEFDVATLQPTYRLLIGVPGKSNAFAISKRLGLSESIIEDAKDLITQQDKQFEDLITDLEISKKTIEEEKKQAVAYRNEIEKLKQELEDKKSKLQNQKERILQEAKTEAHKLLREAKQYADESIRKFNKLTSSNGIKEAEKERQALRNKLSDLETTLTKRPTSKKNVQSVPKHLRAGDMVFVNSFNQNGTVIDPPNAKGETLVQMGIIKTKVHVSDLTLVHEQGKNVHKTTSSGKVAVNKSAHIRPEVDVRGKTVEEAISTIDKYLDDAYLSHLPQVTIIHGKGTGTLRQAIHQYLKGIKYVKSYRLGNFGEGEAGVTIVNFK